MFRTPGNEGKARIYGRLLATHEKTLVAPPPPVTTPEAPYGTMAYLGRSTRNRPIILTTGGPLEMAANPRRTTLPHNIFILKTGRRWRVVNRYAETFAPAYLAMDGTLWIEGNSACVSAPQNKPGALKTSETACMPENNLRARERISAATEPDFERVLNLLPELSAFRGGHVHGHVMASPDSGNDFLEVLAVRKSPFLIVRIGCGDCD